MTLMITNEINIIDPENFKQQVLEESILIFICHIIIMKEYPPGVFFFEGYKF